MTIGEAMALVDRLTANQSSGADKLAWLSGLDASLYLSVWKTHRMPEDGGFAGYGPETPPDTGLLAPPPFDEIYRWYLEMQIHGANGETARYNAAAEKYNAALIAYMDWVNRRYAPLGTRMKWW